MQRSIAITVVLGLSASASLALAQARETYTARLGWVPISGAERSLSNSGPIVAGGLIIQGMGTCAIYERKKCFISAYDPATGQQRWRFETIARTGEPGGDTWGTLPDLFRADGEAWITGSYDPELGLTYWGTAQAKPWMPVNRGMRASDAALYTSSTVALDAATGELAWYFQHAPGESFDLDAVFERVLVDAGPERWVFSVGKDGVLWKLDRVTGAYIDHAETGLQNIWASFDPETGRPRYRADILDCDGEGWLEGCPSTAGGKNWPAMSFHRPSRQLVIPLSQSCVALHAQPVKQVAGGSPRGVPATITPEIRVPDRGQALYVFALPRE